MDLEVWENAGWTVQEAARHGSVDMLETLIKIGGLVDVRDNRGWTPLHEAACGNHGQCLRLLLEHEKTDVNWRSDEWTTALWIACDKGNADAVKVLLENQANPNIGNAECVEPLMAATIAKSLECVKLLLQHGANVNAKDTKGNTALHWAAGNDDSSILQELLNHVTKTGVYQPTRSPFFYAAVYRSTSNLHNIQFQAQKPAELGDIGCESGLFLRAGGKHSVIRNERRKQYMINRQAENGITPLMIAVMQGQEQNVKILFDNGADVNTRTECGMMALHQAILYASTSVVDLVLPYTDHSLLEQCCLGPLFALDDEYDDPSSDLQSEIPESHRDSYSPLHMALDSDRQDCLELLLQAELKPDIYLKSCPTDSMADHIYQLPLYTALSWALSRNSLVCAEILLKAGASPNSSQPVLVVPPLLAVLERGNVDGLELLLRYDVELGLRYLDEDHVPFDLATAVGYPDCLAVLLQHGVQPSLCYSQTVSETPWEFVWRVATEFEFIDEYIDNRPAYLCDVIELLFQYAANKITTRMMTQFHSLCVEYGDKIRENVRVLLDKPSTLFHLCRLTVRQNILQNGWRDSEQKVNSLLVPAFIKQLLFFSNNTKLKMKDF